MPDPGEARDTKSATTKWAGRNLGPPLRFCAPEVLQNPAGTRSPQRGLGKAVLWARSARRPRPQRRFGYFAAEGKVTRPAGRNPCKAARRGRRALQALAARRRRNFPVHNQFNPNPAPSSVWPSASHLPPRGKAEREEAKHSFAQNSFAYFSFKKSRRR